MRRFLALFPPLIFISTGCVEVPPIDPEPDPNPGPSDPCLVSTDLVPGETTELFEIEHDGETRTYQVHVPAGYTGQTPVPLVFGIHGLTQGATMFENGSDLDEKSDEAGFIAVFANGEGNSWNAGDCCSSDSDRDDVGFFRKMVRSVRTDLGLCVDRTRVYATGYSNGGFMSYRLACEASDLFAAVAPVAGSLTIAKESCEATLERPVPMLHIHGTSDGIVNYDDAASGFSAVRSARDWADIAGCSGTTVPAAQPASQLDTSCVTYTGCPEGVEVTLCSVDDGGHCWFGNETCGTGVAGGQLFVGNNAEGIVAADAVWDFLSRFECEGCGI